MDYFYQIEERDGARFSFNVWPSNKTETTKATIPIGCMYTPQRRGTTAPRVGYDPVTCKGCKICLNPYCPVDIATKVWTCSFCGQRNQFPAHYSGMTETNLPAELLPNVTTIEYALTRQQRNLPPVFLFVVDTCISAEELQALKDSLMQTLELLPQNAFVGFVAFGTVVQVYELAFTHMTRAHVFRGNREPTPKEVQHMLGIPLSLEGHAQPQPRNNFILPLAQAEESIQRIIEELQRDPRVVKSGMRALRATGPAVATAVSMLENTFPNTGARVMVFLGGPATQGPGQIVSEELKESIRSHHDLVKESAKYVGKSAKFYQGLAERAAKNGHAVDLFAVSLDQVGFLEMASLSKKTGGVMVMSDTFEHEIFRKSLQKMFEKDADGNLKLYFNATLEVFTSREVKVMGAIGHMTSLNKKGANVSENELGIGGTSAWKMCSFDPNSTFAIYFDVAATAANPIPRGQNALVQFQTMYNLSSGQPILRVTTVAYGYADPAGGPAAILAGMDQEACAALMARIAVWRGENDDPAPIKWLDRQLIRVMARYGEYRKGEVTSFQIPQTLGLYPQFMFHLRRGLLIQVFGSSPDETVFFRHCALRENVPNTLVMIQPTLDAYSFDSEPVPVMLSVTSIQPNRILLLDTFFHVVIFHGETVAAWRKAGYHEKAEYANLKELLAAPQEDAKDMLENRFPHPIFVDCDQGGSQARFILAILDPAVTHMTNQVPGQPSSGSGGVIFTEDISMKSFMDALKKRAVDYEQ